MTFPSLRWGPGVSPTAFEILDWRVRADRNATEAERRAWTSQRLGLGWVSADDVQALAAMGPPPRFAPVPTNSAHEAAEAARRCAEADRGGYR